MKQDANYPYNMAFLVERYEVRQQSMHEYVKNHISELNEGGVHARKFGKEWRFDEVAVNRLDELRGYIGAALTVVDYESPEMARLVELEAELKVARQVIQDYEKRIESRDETIRIQSEMMREARAKAKEKLLLASAKAEAEKNEQEKQIALLKNENLEIHQQLSKERSKSIFVVIKERMQGILR